MAAIGVDARPIVAAGVSVGDRYKHKGNKYDHYDKYDGYDRYDAYGSRSMSPIRTTTLKTVRSPSRTYRKLTVSKSRSQSPVRQTTARKSPVKRASPARRSPARKSPKRRSPNKRSPAIGRKAPTSPAKLQKVNVVMKGNDGRLWKVKIVTKQDGTKYKKWVLA